MMTLLLATFLVALASAQSNATFSQCIGSALGGDASLYALSTDPSFGVKPYNLDYPITPAAVTYPKAAEQVAGVVKCAHAAGLAVQARSGGHSYANYGKIGVAVKATSSAC